jgi:LEA14-like dessication related protein
VKSNNRISLFSKIFIYLIPAFFVILTGCGKVNDINIKSINEVKFRGLKKNIIMLSLEVEIDNPNTRKISITDIEFKAWLNNRELGDFRTTEHIKLIPCSRQPYIIPVEIELITIADAFRLATSGSFESLFDKIEVEGFIKGKSFPIRKKIKLERQPFRNLANTL